jgi:hypothetical protein
MNLPLFVVVVVMNGVVIAVEGPFDSLKAAHDWSDPRNETQKGAIVGTVWEVDGTHGR